MNLPRHRFHEKLFLPHATVLAVWLAGATIFGASVKAEPPVKRSPDEVLVVYNSNSPTSIAIAHDYQARRQVKNAVAVQCRDAAIATSNETLSFEEYKSSIEAPVRAWLASHPGINFIVTTKGVPLRILGAETGCRTWHRYSFLADYFHVAPLRASVDGHLAALGYGDGPNPQMMPITGSGATGFAWLNHYYNANEPFSHAKFGGYLVTRLDGYTASDAMRLVSLALESEKQPVDGKVLFDVDLDYGLGDKNAPPETFRADHPILEESSWDSYNAAMIRAHDLLDQRGVPNELAISREFVGDRSNLLGYFSWGSNDAHFTNQAYQSLRFAPGSIGDTAVSTSARTFLPTTGGQSLLADLIAHGLTCAKGYTDEPLLQAISNPSILLERYTSGYTMAESFYMASPFVGWQDVIIGDPLCCPYPHGYARTTPRPGSERKEPR
jgi:uncharacterized protein (TIGR03790 family)